MVTNEDVFNEFVAFIRGGASDQDITREYGGGSLYIPSFKNIYRNDIIIQEFKDGKSVRELARDYELSTKQIYDITRAYRDSMKTN